MIYFDGDIFFSSYDQNLYRWIISSSRTVVFHDSSHSILKKLEQDVIQVGWNVHNLHSRSRLFIYSNFQIIYKSFIEVIEWFNCCARERPDRERPGSTGRIRIQHSRKHLLRRIVHHNWDLCSRYVECCSTVHRIKELYN